MTLEQNKEARLKSAREWRKRNPEKQRGAVRRCRNTPKAKEAHRNRQLEYAVEHRDQEKLRAAQWRKENPEKSRASQRSSYQANKTSAIQKARIYYRSHKEQTKVWSREYKARKRAGGGRLSRGYVGKMFVDQKGKCSACRVSLSVSGYHIDHIIALSKGGKHCDQNVQLLCPTCNRRKSAREWTEFLKIMEAENA
jgi:5-methylcytosine-specific restriction endonuclease McrA